VALDVLLEPQEYFILKEDFFFLTICSLRPEKEKGKSKKEKGKSAGSRTTIPAPKKADMTGIDLVFDSETFDEKSYSSQLFEAQDKDKVKDAVESRLLASRDLAAKRLQESVHHNYPLFISTSKEISNLEVDMLELRNHLTEVNAVIKGLQNVALNTTAAPPQQRIRQAASGDSSSVISDIHWLLELPDELDILTSERLFEAAVSLVERAEKLKEKEKGATGRYDAVFKSIKEAYDARVQALSASLLKDLQNPALKKTESRTVITFLTRLGFAKTARQIFLETRARKIRSDVSKLKYDNNTSLYVNELARVVFTAIDSTCDDFQHCFGKDSTMTSGFVVWTIQEMANILSLFRRHVFFSSDIDNFTLVGKCFEITTAHCKMLEQRGLSLTFYLRQTFHKDLVSVINNYYQRMEATFAKQLTEESWDSKSVPSLDGKSTLQVTESCRYVETMSMRFINGVLSVWSQELVPTVIFTMVGLLEKYLTDISRLLRSQSDLNDRQRLAIVSNASYISTKVLPQLFNAIEPQLKYIPNELADFRKRLTTKIQEMKQHYAFATARSIVCDQLDWEHTTYPMESIDDASAAPSPNVVRVFEYVLGTLSTDITNAIGANEVKELQTLLFSRIVDEMGIGPFWSRESDKEESMFGGEGGLQQFILDMKFCLEACAPFRAPDIADKIKALIDRGILNYCTAKKVFKNLEKILKDDVWEKKVIKAAIQDFNRKSK
jgi:hypothetical protein